MSGFGSSSVKGRNRLPRPAARTHACVISFMRRKAKDSSASLGMRTRTDRSYGAACDFIRNDKGRSAVGLPQVKRARAKVDDAVVTPQCFCTEQAGNRWGTL